MSNLERISEIVGRFTAPRQNGDWVVVPTFAFYPSNSMVQIFVETNGESFVVSDGGGAVDTLHGAGGYTVDYRKFMTPLLRRNESVLSSEGWIVAKRVPAESLTYAISEMTALTMRCAELLLKHFRTMEGFDFRSQVDTSLSNRFHSHVLKKAHLVGASNKTHTFDYLVKLPEGRSIVIDTVVPEASSVNAALVSHLDLKNSEQRDIKQAIVYDDFKPWKSSDLALLSMAAPPIGFSHFNELIERLAT